MQRWIFVIIKSTLLMFFVLSSSCTKSYKEDKTADNQNYRSVKTLIEIETADKNEIENDQNYQIENYEYNIDPLLFCYLPNSPTIRFDMSANVMKEYIEYKNYATREINYGDATAGTGWYSIFLFKNGLFCGIDNVETYESEVTRIKQKEIIHNADGSITVNEYRLGTNSFLREHLFRWTDNTLVANEGVRGGNPVSVLVKEENSYIYFSSRSDYTQNRPYMRVELNDEEIIIYNYNWILGEVDRKNYYQNGIRMKVEHLDGRTETYTVFSGNGEIITTDSEGVIIERAILKRIVNEDGYLIYEEVGRQHGRSYEYFITADIFN